ncbi:MAG: Rrf2 family transcriptional regulator [Hyphomicrobium sp.]
MRLTKQTGHAIRILIDCALAGDGLVKVGDVAKRLDITPQNAFKIVHLLARAGFVASVRGPSGGIRLARAAEDIRVGDVVMAMEQTSVAIAGEQPRSSTGSPNALTSLFDDALAAFVSVLDGHTLAELAAAHRPRPALRSPSVSDPKGQTPSLPGPEARRAATRRK